MKRALLAAVVVLSSARCATMINETTEQIPVRSTPAGAVVSVDCGSAPLYGGVTPATITVPRAASPCSITLAKEGYLARRVDFHRELSHAIEANRAAAVPAGVLGALVSVVVTSVTPMSVDDAASAGYAIGKSVANAGADRIDERTGGAYKQVPGEVDVTLDPEPTTQSPPQ
ncbi:MAG: hypothetical protein JO093_19355 [Acidobacteria bacterium]|nr:hypothetical protein [Acidobacteriota bacterium]MBV9069836.1 hypothetical protein [Acidobacteriota bacterium]MBV9187782.1 hypothetical protein [Acidobacteriota bacterium]